MALKRISRDSVFIHPSHSRTNTGISLSHGNTFESYCGSCELRLGWTWADNSGDDTVGFWSCMHGCKNVVSNSLMDLTSSVLRVDEDQEGGFHSKRVKRWIAAWLDVPEDQVEVITE